MAGDWIKWVKGLARKSEVLQVARLLKRDRHEIAARLMVLWEWADDETEDGHVPGGTPEFVDEHVGVSGFFCALETTGWARSTDRGISLVNWSRHNGESAKKRARQANSSATYRGKRQPVIETSSSRDDETMTREEKRREETKPPQPPSGVLGEFPPALRTDAFMAAWREWEQHRREKRAKVGPTSASRQLKALAAVGEQRAIACIQRSIEKGWTGLFPESLPIDAKPVEARQPRVLDENATAARQWLQEQSYGVRERIVQQYRTASGGSTASTEDILKVMAPKLVAIVNEHRQRGAA